MNIFRMLFGTKGGWTVIGIVTFVGMLYFQPDMLANMISSVLASAINLIGMILTGILNGIAHVLQANQKSLEYLFYIGLLCIGIVLMFRSVFRRGGGAKK